MSSYDGASALVTGGAGAIGLAVAQRLIALGAAVTLADLDVERGPARAAEIGAHFTRCDVTRPADLVEAMGRAEEHGPLRMAHLNAGIVLHRGYDDTDEAAYRRIVGVNLDGVFWGIRAAVPALRRAGGGAIVATASLAGLVSVPLDPLYAMTKSGVVSLVRSIGPMLAPEHIRLNCVCPGFVDTPMVPDLLREQGFPLLTAAQVADAVVGVAGGEEHSQAYVLQPGLDPFSYRFRGVPGARATTDAGTTTVSALAVVGLGDAAGE